MNRTKDRFPLFLLALLAAVLLAGSAWGKTLVADEPGQENPARKEIRGGEKAQEGGKQGWKSKTPIGTYPHRPGHPGVEYVLYPLDNTTAFSPGKGSIELTVRRDKVSGQGDSPAQTLFEFLDPDNSSPLTVFVYWETPGRLSWLDNGTMLTVWGKDYKGDLWGDRLFLGRQVQPGETVRLVFNWGPGKNGVWADGKEAVRYHLDGVGPALRSGDPGTYLSRVNRVRLGISSQDGKYYPLGYNPLSGSTLFGFSLNDTTFVRESVIRSVTDDSFRIPGISGKLVAGDKVTVSLLAVPGGKASFDMGKARRIPMEEVPPRDAAPGITAVVPGTYSGSYAVKPGDDFESGQIVGSFVSSDNVAAEPVLSASKWTIDTKPKVTFKIDRKDLPADSASKARVKLAAVDANGNPLKGRHLKLTLATTDDYTGTVGAGDFGKEVGATVETRWKGETDSWGELEFDYTAGFAAKTVILTAKDLDSGGVAVDYLTAFKEASIDIALTAPVNRAAARRGLQYILKVEASRTELTADGRSRSVIRATLSDPNGTPVAGDPVAFALSSANGTLRTIEGTTNASGVATAEYVAGKRIGIVVITATATLRNASGNVSIILLSDAPAKIYLKAKPETLPADGFSRADLSVKVTDINDNPNKDTKVEFRIAKGGGKLEYPDRLTDRFGDTQNRYTSGTAPGIATVAATVRSKIPTEGELSKARNVLFAPYNPEGDEIRVERWRKKKGDTVLSGEPVLEYTVGRSREVLLLTAPYDLRLDRIEVEYWDRAEAGQTLAVFTPIVR